MKQLNQTNQIKNLLRLIHKSLGKKKKIFFLFDYDGVLVPLQNDPRTTFLPPEKKEKLYKLAKKENIKVALVSGRDLKTLKRLTKIKSKNITLVGSHGLEIYKNGKNDFLFKNNKQVMNKIKSHAIKHAKKIANGFTEHKPHSFTYHIRDKRKKDFVHVLYKSIKSLIKEKNLSKSLKILKGKRMIEILPEGVNKGKAVEKLIKQNPNCLYVYFGDDVTDVYAFKKIKKYKGIVISLNPKLKFKPNIYLRNPKDVENFLNEFFLHP